MFECRSSHETMKVIVEIKEERRDHTLIYVVLGEGNL